MAETKKLSKKAKVSEETKPEKIEVKAKTEKDIAKEAIKGLWGYGTTRMMKIVQAGYDYLKVKEEIEKIINE